MPQLLGHPHSSDQGLGRQSACLGSCKALVFISSTVRKQENKQKQPNKKPSAPPLQTNKTTKTKNQPNEKNKALLLYILHQGLT